MKTAQTIFEKFGSLLFKLKRTLSGKKRHRYEYFFDTEGSTAPAYVVQMVGHKRTVLEIGAGPGSISRTLVEKNNCHVTAIEYDESALLKLQEVCHQAIRADLNAEGWINAVDANKQFEVIVIADVLEHLYDPWRTLSQAKELLTETGALVISLPHAGHNSVIASLLNTDFKYHHFGLLDSTHIRFFGINNIQTMIKDAGLKIVDVRFVINPPEKTELSSQWKKLPQEMQTTLINNPYGNIYQVVFKAVSKDSIPDEGIDLITVATQARLAG